MSILFILAQAELTTSTLCALATAFEIRSVENVAILSRDSGNLDDHLSNWFSLVKICNVSIFPYEERFSQRIPAARKIIAALPSDIVWVDSFVASDFALAAKLEGRNVVLQSYDAITDIPRFLEHDLMKRDLGKYLDGLILPRAEWLQQITAQMENLPGRIVFRPPRMLTGLDILAEKTPEEWRKTNNGYIELIRCLRENQSWKI